jgi:DNA-binding MarR family transcriptional regulator
MSAKVVEGKLKTVQSEIDNLTNQMIKLQTITTEIIYSRKETSEPLNFTEAKNFKQLNDDFIEIQSKVKKLQREKTKLQNELDLINQAKDLKLTQSEFKIIELLKQHPSTGLTGHRIAQLTALARARVYEHLRSFQVAGYVQTQASQRNKTNAYFMTTIGINFFDRYKKAQAET